MPVVALTHPYFSSSSDCLLSGAPSLISGFASRFRVSKFALLSLSPEL